MSSLQISEAERQEAQNASSSGSRVIGSDECRCSKQLDEDAHKGEQGSPRLERPEGVTSLEVVLMTSVVRDIR